MAALCSFILFVGAGTLTMFAIAEAARVVCILIHIIALLKTLSKDSSLNMLEEQTSQLKSPLNSLAAVAGITVMAYLFIQYW